MELSEDLIVRTTDNILEWIDEKLKFVEVGPKNWPLMQLFISLKCFRLTTQAGEEKLTKTFMEKADLALEKLQDVNVEEIVAFGENLLDTITGQTLIYFFMCARSA